MSPALPGWVGSQAGLHQQGEPRPGSCLPGQGGGGGGVSWSGCVALAVLAGHISAICEPSPVASGRSLAGPPGGVRGWLPPFTVCPQTE